MKTKIARKELFWFVIMPFLIAGMTLIATFYFFQNQLINDKASENEALAIQLFNPLQYRDLSESQSQTLIEQHAKALLATEAYKSISILEEDGSLSFQVGTPYPPQEVIEFSKDSEYAVTVKHPQQGRSSSASIVAIKSPVELTLSIYKSLVVLVILIAICTITLNSFVRKFRDNLSSPIHKLEMGVINLLQGEYEKKIDIESSSDFSDIASNLNQLSLIQKSATEEKQIDIDQSTLELRETLETVEIQNIELDLARKTALQASRIKSEFLANTTHEIRTPLNGILGFSELLKKTELNNQQADYLNTIEQSAAGLLTIINDILDFSRLEIGTLTLEYKPVRMRQLVEDVIKLQSPTANEKNIRILTVIDHDVPEHLLGDPLRIKQVLTNLISNAIKFTDEGYILIGVSNEKFLDNQFNIKFRITDSGIGLSQDQQDRLFDPFTQIDGSESRMHGGTGLGLAIAKGLVERMLGTIGVESSLGKGATFWFTSSLGTSPGASQHQRYLADTLRNVNALVFDHSPMGRMEISHYLKGWGANTIEINELREITLYCASQEQGQPNIAIIDCMADMVTFDKQSLNNVIKEITTTLGIPVIILAPASIQRLMDQSFDSTQFSYVNRPLFCNRLHEKICQLMDIVTTRIEIIAEEKMDNAMSIQKAHILAVDDNPANLKLVSELLKGLNVEVTPVESGEEAISQVNDRSFDLVLMDIQMPGLDGIETTKRIRDNEGSSERTPIIALTAHAVSEQKSRLLLAGMDDCLSKPVSESELRHVIERWTNIKITPSKAKQIAPVSYADTISFNTGSYNTGSYNTISHNTDSQSLLTEKAISSDQPLTVNAEEVSGVVDLSLGLSLTNNNASLAKDMLTMLVGTLSITRKKIITHHENLQLEELQEVVHKLYGGSCYCGVPQLTEISEKVDKALQKNQLETLDEDIARLIEEINSLIDWSEEYDIEALFDVD